MEHTLDRFIPWDLSPDEDGQYFRRPACSQGRMASFGIERKSNKAMAMEIRSQLSWTTKDSKAGIK